MKPENMNLAKAMNEEISYISEKTEAEFEVEDDFIIGTVVSPYEYSEYMDELDKIILELSSMGFETTLISQNKDFCNGNRYSISTLSINRN